MQRKLCEIFGPDEDSNSQNSSISSNSSNSNFQFTIQTDSLSPTRKVMKIQYQDYYNRILTSEMKSLMHQSYLNDVQFVCKDGNVSANCLIIGNFKVMSLSWNFPSWAEPSWKVSEPSRDGHFNFRAETELDFFWYIAFIAPNFFFFDKNQLF